MNQKYFLLVSLLLTVGVDGGHDVDIEPVEDVAVLVRVLHQLSHDVGASGGRDPFSGVYSTVNPDGLSGAVATSYSWVYIFLKNPYFSKVILKFPSKF